VSVQLATSLFEMCRNAAFRWQRPGTTPWLCANRALRSRSILPLLKTGVLGVSRFVVPGGLPVSARNSYDLCRSLRTASLLLLACASLSSRASGLEWIDTSIENASPLWYEFTSDGVIQIHLNYDHERGSSNRAAGHIHFLLHASPGSKLTLEFKNLDNIYNGRPGSVARELRALVVSTNGTDWRSVATEVTADQRVRLAVEMPGPRLFVARIEPYRLSDLDRWLASIRTHPRVIVTPVGQTAEGRTLEIIRVGQAQAPHRVFLRARSHPWESGGNWVVQGLLQRLLRDDEDARRFLRSYCLYVMPMANKDGVVRGWTRFNLNGKDLNRDWDQPADPRLAPENHALEQWLERTCQAGLAPDLALELHNDGYGALHLNQPIPAERARYFQHMATLERLLRKHTWFTEGCTTNLHSAGTLASGWQSRYRIAGVVHEFNCQWIAGLKDRPLGRHWERYGAGLAAVFDEYFETVKP
jgi:hypothetical protein